MKQKKIFFCKKTAGKNMSSSYNIYLQSFKMTKLKKKQKKNCLFKSVSA